MPLLKTLLRPAPLPLDALIHYPGVKAAAAQGPVAESVTKT